MGFGELQPVQENKKGDSLGHPRTIPLKMGTKKGKGTPTALEATVPVIFYPLDFAWLASGKAYPHKQGFPARLTAYWLS